MFGKKRAVPTVGFQDAPVDKTRPGQNRVKRHATMPFRENEPIAVRTIDGGGSAVHNLSIERRQDVNARQRYPDMARMLGHHDNIVA